jgi:DNA-binding LytR/AlgR family response regulator
MTRALIADDEPHLAHYLKEQLQQLWPELEIVHVARNGLEAAAKIAELQPDLAFLDIQMPGLNGLEVAQGIEGATRVVFVTAYEEYAVQAFEHAAQGDLMHQIAVEDVLFFHADDKYTVVQTASREHLLRTPIMELVQQLDPEQFWQVHRAKLINLKYLAGTRRDETSRLFVRIKGYAHELPVSRAYVHLFKSM